MLEHLVDVNEFTSARIFNVDEKSHTVLLGFENIAQKGDFSGRCDYSL
jgi:hypothetical protein